MFYSISRRPTLRIAKIEGIALIDNGSRIQKKRPVAGPTLKKID